VAVLTSASTDVEIQKPDGTWLGLMLAKPRDQSGAVVEGSPVTVEEALAAGTNDIQVSKRLVAEVRETWAGGIGIDYAAAYGLYTRTPGYALPAGAVTEVGLPPATSLFGPNPYTGPISGFEEYNGDFYVSYGNLVVVIPGGAGLPAISKTFPTNEFVRGLIVFDNGSGTKLLYAMTSDTTGANGKMYSWNGTAWSAGTSMGAWGRGAPVKVYWSAANQIGDMRIVCISSPTTISYTLPQTNPELAASWVDGVRIGSGRNLVSLVAARRHVWATDAVGEVFDINEFGESVSLTSYTDRMLRTGVGTSGPVAPALYLDGYLLVALGQSLDRIRVDQGPGILQELPGQCAPGWGTSVLNKIRGPITALAQDQGFVVTAQYDVTTASQYLCWGKSREVLNVDTPNPLVWYGPEVWFTIPLAIVTSMRTSALAGDLRLWIAFDSLVSTLPRLFWASLPISGSPIQDLIAGGVHRYTTGSGTEAQPYCRLESLPKTYDDKASTKIIHQHAVGTIGVEAGSGTKLTYYDRADAPIGSNTWPVGVDVTTGPVQEIAPSTTVTGHKLEERIDFFAPQGGASPPKVPILDSLRTTVWRVAPDFSVRAIAVEYGAGILDLGDAEDIREPDDVTNAILALTRSGPTVLRDRRDKRWRVKLEQVLDRTETLHESSGGKTVRASIEVTVIAEAT
jgi:hypothetical protein